MARLNPGLPGAVVRPSREVYGDRLGVHLTVDKEVFEQFRTGYRCLKCYAAQDEPFPEKCIEWYCGFRMRDLQGDLIHQEYKGEEELWPDREPAENPGGLWLPGDKE